MNLRDGTKVQYAIDEIQKIDFSGITNIEDAKKIEHVIKSFKLLQNYPNPFNPGTTIEYQIPAEGDVQINIFSITGQLVRTFKNAHAAQGAYAITWDGKNDTGQSVASGLYIYRVSYANSVISKKMLFVK